MRKSKNLQRKYKFRIKILEETAAFLGDFRIPKGDKWQEQHIKKYYQAANKYRQKLGLPKKDYHFINSKGVMERVE
jgi:hypothetical protein